MGVLSDIEGSPLEHESGIGALTLPGFIKELALRYPERQALAWRDLSGVQRRWSYTDVLHESSKVAKALLAAGVGRDSRVGVLISNRPEWIFNMFGVAMAGAVTVAINTFSTREELKYQLAYADVSLLIFEAGVASQDFVGDILALCPALEEFSTGSLYNEDYPFLQRVVCIDSDRVRGRIEAWDRFLEQGTRVPDSVLEATTKATSPPDRALILFSSGSTGRAKAVQHTHRAATLQLWRLGKLLELDNAVRTWNANGFFFSGNFSLAFCTFSVGGCLVLSRYFDPQEAIALIQEEQVSCVIAWPHQEARMKDCPGWERADFSSVRYPVNAESPFRAHPTVNTSWRGFNGYGMTETFTLVCGVSGKDMDRGSHGVVFPGNRIRVIDPQSGEILPMGSRGEMIVKGATLTPGYLKHSLDAILDSDGFFHTGDEGYVTEDGHVFYTGRLSETIKTGGANVSPVEVDDVLARHPAVRISITVGVPHATLGEMVVSCIVLYNGAQLEELELIRYAKEFLSSYKAPRKVVFLTDKELPMTGSNKVRRSQLRELLAGRFDFSAA